MKGRLSHPGQEVKKPEIGDGVTEGGREEVDAFSRYFISHFGHQVSCISGDRLETHLNLSMGSCEGLLVAHTVGPSECNSASLILSVFEGRDSPSFFGELGKRYRGRRIFVET